MGIFGKKKEKDQDKKPAASKVEADKKSNLKKDSKEDHKKPAKQKDVSVDKKKEDIFKPGSAYRVLVKPLITEKASIGGSQDKYYFAVSNNSNKIEIANSIKEVYGIKPISVNVVTMKGKKTRQGRTLGRRKDWKKAIVTLPKGKSINIYEGV